jgi:hypothetical membrane protein
MADPGSSRILALGAVAGPAAFITAWATLGAVRDGYTPIHTAISRLAEQGASTAPFMAAGFIAFGVLVPSAATVFRREVDGLSWVAMTVTGLATLGVAATPLGGRVDTLHGVFAGTGYVSLSLLPLTAVPILRAAGRHRAAAVAMATTAVAGACLGATLDGRAHGFFQRAGLTVGDAWMATAAVGVALGRGPLRWLRRPE